MEINDGVEMACTTLSCGCSVLPMCDSLPVPAAIVSCMHRDEFRVPHVDS